MRNKNNQLINLVELNNQELVVTNGGGSGSENGAYIAGRVVGHILLGPFASVFYAVRALDI